MTLNYSARDETVVTVSATKHCNIWDMLKKAFVWLQNAGPVNLEEGDWRPEASPSPETVMFLSVTVFNCPGIPWCNPLYSRAELLTLRNQGSRNPFLVYRENRLRTPPWLLPPPTMHLSVLSRWLFCHVSSTERAPAWRLRGERPPAVFLRGSGDERKFLGAPVPSVCSSGQNGEDRENPRR